MTSDAAFPVQQRLPVFRETDRLMTSVRTGDHASAAPYTSFPVELRVNDRIPLEDICGLAEGSQPQTDCFGNIPETFLREIQ